MQKVVIFSIAAILILAGSFALYQNRDITGSATADIPHSAAISGYGPSQSDINCMRPCTSEGCTPGDTACMMANSEKCQAKCSIQKPEQTEDEKCVEACALQGCEKYDFECQELNQAKCDKECGMINEPEAKSEEEQCIRDCVNKIQPGLICRGAEGGEQGGDVCQKCAQECVHLYAGPCLDDTKLKAKQEACKTCEHCYGAPITGDSGEGYDCIVDVECKDASSEFGDEPGTGEGIGTRVAGTVSTITEKVVGFFRGLFGGEEAPAESSQEAVAETPSEQ